MQRASDVSKNPKHGDMAWIDTIAISQKLASESCSGRPRFSTLACCSSSATSPLLLPLSLPTSDAIVRYGEGTVHGMRPPASMRGSLLISPRSSEHSPSKQHPNHSPPITSQSPPLAMNRSIHCLGIEAPSSRFLPHYRKCPSRTEEATANARNAENDAKDELDYSLETDFEEGSLMSPQSRTFWTRKVEYWALRAEYWSDMNEALEGAASASVEPVADGKEQKKEKQGDESDVTSSCSALSRIHTAENWLCREQNAYGVATSKSVETATDGQDEPGLDEEEDERRKKRCEKSVQDRKDILIKRLTDVVAQLCTDSIKYVPDVTDADLSALHAQVADMEHVLLVRKAMKPEAPSPPALAKQEEARKDSHKGNPSLVAGLCKWVRPPTPPWMRFMNAKYAALYPDILGPKAPPMTPERVLKVMADQAGAIEAELNMFFKNLKARRDEFEHINKILVHKAQCASVRVSELEAEYDELDDEVTANESELRHLRLQLRAIETLYQEFAPDDLTTSEEHTNLIQSIENWKVDWLALRAAMATRKANRLKRTAKRDRTDQKNEKGCGESQKRL